MERRAAFAWRRRKIGRPINPLDPGVLPKLEAIQKEFNTSQLAALSPMVERRKSRSLTWIVLVGCGCGSGGEESRISMWKVFFTPGRTDASQEQTDAHPSVRRLIRSPMRSATIS